MGLFVFSHASQWRIYLKRRACRRTLQTEHNARCVEKRAFHVASFGLYRGSQDRILYTQSITIIAIVISVARGRLSIICYSYSKSIHNGFLQVWCFFCS